MVRYKNGRDSITSADEQQAQELLTALKEKVQEEAEALGIATVLPTKDGTAVAN